MSVRVFYEILNQRGTPAMFTDTLANRPAFGFAGRLFVSTDSGQIFEDTGSAWTLVADAGVGGGTLSSVCLNGNTTATGIVITAGGLSTNSLTDTALTAGSILYAGSGGLISQSNSTFFWDATNNRLGIGINAPGAPLDIHATGTNAQFNGTGTNNAYLQFQNAGVSKWRIGNTYNGAANSFDIYNNGLTTSAISIQSSSNDITLTGNLNNTGKVISTGAIVSNSILSVINNGSVTGTNGYSSFSGNLANNGFTFAPNNTNYLRFIVPTSANYDYTFPAVTGTIALLENTNTFTLINTFSSASKYAAGVLFQQNGSYTTISGYTGIAGVTNGLYIAMGTTAVQGLYFPTGANYGYTFPSASGTLALTSNLSSYLPLTGGTLTGQLYINPTNTGITGLDVASDSVSFRSDNLEGFKRQLLITMGSGTLIKFQAQGYGANYGTDLGFYTATTGGANSTPAIYITGTNNRVGIKTGTPSYDLDVTGTIGVSSTSNFSARINGIVGGTAYNTAGLWLQGSSATDGMAIGGTSGGNKNIDTYGGTLALNYISSNGVIMNGDLGIGTATTSGKIHAVGVNTSSSNNLIYLENAVATMSFKVRNDSAVFFRSSYPFTTAALANMVLDSSGVIQLSVSSLKYKKDINNYNKGLEEVLKLRPVTFRSKNSLTDGDKLFAGFIAEEIEELGMTEYVVYAEDNSPNALAYSNMVALLTKAIQELNEKLVRNNIN
jgi:Chaperone of endosialidase